MRHPNAGWLTSTLVAAGVLLGSVQPAPAAEALAGTWKVNMQLQVQQFTLALLKIADQDGKLKPSILSVGIPDATGNKINKFSVDDRTLQLNFDIVFKQGSATFPIKVYLPRGDKSPKKLLGSAAFRGAQFAWLERTDLKELDPKTAGKPSPSLDDLRKALQNENAEESLKAFQEIEKKHPSDPLVCLGAMNILTKLSQGSPKEKDVRAIAEGSVKRAAAYGPEMKLQVTGQVASALAGSKKTAGVAIDYARQAEKMFTKDDPFLKRRPVLLTLARALRATGKEKEAAELDARIEKEASKEEIPFKVEPYTGKGKGGRVAVLELFTGSQCPPCVAADIAFDALIKTYKPSEAVLLEYHLHIPGPDPMTNADSEARAKYYSCQSTPTITINGKAGPPTGGDWTGAEGGYHKLRAVLDKDLDEATSGKLKLTVQRKGDNLDIKAEVSGLKKTGDDVRLRFVVVEDKVHYVGGNGQRFHHHVVRAMPGGAAGSALKSKTARQSRTVSLKELSKTLTDYMSDKGFPEARRPLDLKHLKVVAFIQDDENKQIIQAAQVDVPEAKSDK
jgi:hypothetical protein